MNGYVLTSVKLRNQLRRMDPELVVELRPVKVNGAVFGCSGFVSRGGHYVYVSADHNHGTRVDQPLYRVARDNRDYTGETNRFSTNANLARDVVALLDTLTGGRS